MVKKILFLTGTRADYSKLKSYITILKTTDIFNVELFVTGMHMDNRYGNTINQIINDNIQNLFPYINQTSEENMDVIIANTIKGLSSYVYHNRPDLIVIHGDRLEALAGAIVGAFNNILVAHIEGGELTGTIDDSIRHAVSKLAHIHFVSNAKAKKRLIQMGEKANSIFVTGSPDVDIMLSNDLPPMKEVKDYYNIPYDNYGISILHPVTTEIENFPKYSKDYFEALEKTGKNWILIYPNNDPGGSFILNEIKKRKGLKNFKIFKSMRFEFFLTLAKNCSLFIGNSSAGIREIPYYGKPVINVGSRQNNRSENNQIKNIDFNLEALINSINENYGKSVDVIHEYGLGSSNKLFFNYLKQPSLWKTPIQKSFQDQL